MVNEESVNSIYQVTLNGEGLHLDQSVNKKQAKEIIEIVLGAGRSTEHSTDNEEERAKDGFPDNPPISLGEFIEQSGAQYNADKIAAIAAFLTDYEGRAVFQKADLNRFQDAGEARPKNFSRDFSQAESSNWIAAGKGGFYLTNTGRTALHNKFPADARKPQVKKSKKAGEG